MNFCTARHFGIRTCLRIGGCARRVTSEKIPLCDGPETKVSSFPLANRQGAVDFTRLKVLTVFLRLRVSVDVGFSSDGGFGECARRLLSEKLRKALLEHFKENEIQFTSKATPGITGCLEVTVNGTLIHSKNNGDGYIDTDAKLKKIIDAVTAALKE